MVTILPPEVIVTGSPRVVCDGDEARGDGHPRVWLQIGASGFADCGYCDRRFVIAGGPADMRAGGPADVHGAAGADGRH